MSAATTAPVVIRSREDARRVYIESERPISLTQLAGLCAGVPRCSDSSLRRACRDEHWNRLRAEYWERRLVTGDATPLDPKTLGEQMQVKLLKDRIYAEAFADPVKSSPAVGSYLKLAEYLRKLETETGEAGVTLSDDMLAKLDALLNE